MERIVHGDFSVGGNLTLTTIPRASSITATDANIGSPTTIIINSASPATFTHTITYSFKGLTGTVANKTAQTTIGWPIPEEFYQKIPDDPSGKVSLTCDTYSGDTKVGTKTTEFTISVPNSSKPIIESATVVDTNQDTIALTGNNKRLVNYCSNAKVTATAKMLNYANFGSFKEGTNSLTKTESVSGGTTTVNGEITYNANARTSFSLEAIDSRGLPSDTKVLNQENGDFTVVPYVPLTINAEFARIAPTTGEVGLIFSGAFYNGYFDAGKTKFNTLSIKYRYKEEGGEWVTEGADDKTNGWRNLKLNADYKHGTGNTYHSGTGSSESIISLGSSFDYKKKYLFELVYADAIKTYIISGTPSTTVKEGEPNHDYGKDRNGNNYFNFNSDIYRNNVNIIEEILKLQNPVGHIRFELTNANPATYLGFGTWEPWGAGRVPVGVDVNDIDFATVEKTGGSKYLQKHKHEIISSTATSGAGSGYYGFTKTEGWATDPSFTVNGLEATEVGEGDSGNCQPFITCYMWKRIA